MVSGDQDAAAVVDEGVVGESPSDLRKVWRSPINDEFCCGTVEWV